MTAVERAQNMGDTTTEQASKNETGLPRNVIIKQRAEIAAKPEYVMDFDESLFPTTNREWIVTTTDLGQEINKRFRPVMRDYVGCTITLKTVTMPAPNAMKDNGNQTPQQAMTPTALAVKVPRYEVDLYFQKGYNMGKCLDGAIDNVIESSAFLNAANGEQTTKVSNNRQKGGFRIDLSQAGINRVNGASNAGSELTINQATRDMLEPFYLDVYKGRVDAEVEVQDPDDPKVNIKTKVKVNKPKYNNLLVYTVNDPSMYTNAQSRYVKVVNLDLLLLLKSIYGNKNELGHYVDYRIKEIRPIPVPMSNMIGNVLNSLVSVEQLDCYAVEKNYNALGMLSMVGGQIPIIR